MRRRPDDRAEILDRLDAGQGAVADLARAAVADALEGRRRGCLIAQWDVRGSQAIEGAVGNLRLLSVAAERHLEPQVRAAAVPTLAALSAREREVLVLVADGLSNAAIAKRLSLSDHTVKRHVSNILLKLDLPTRAAAAALIGRQQRA